MVTTLAVGGDLGRAEGRMSAPPAPPILLASTSPQRRAILQQLGLPFDVATPSYEEHDPPDADAVELVRTHAAGKARSVAGEGVECPVLGVDTAVRLEDRLFGKPTGPEEAEAMLEALGGRTHEGVSGLRLLPPGGGGVEGAGGEVPLRELPAPRLPSTHSSR